MVAAADYPDYFDNYQSVYLRNHALSTPE